MSDEDSMPLTGHLTELRNRILVILGTILGLFLITYFFSAELLELARRPIAGRVDQLVFLKPTEAFFAHLKIAIYAAIFIGLPVLLHQIWQFCAPGLLSREKRYALIFVSCSSGLFITGALFCYFLILPYGLAYLISFGSENILPQISIGFYISFIFTLIFVFGVVFEVPLVIILLVQAGIVTPQALSSNRGYIYVGAFVVAAALTPPDVITQVLMAGPLLVLYEVSIVAAKIITRKKKERAEKAAAGDTGNETEED